MWSSFGSNLNRAHTHTRTENNSTLSVVSVEVCMPVCVCVLVLLYIYKADVISCTRVYTGSGSGGAPGCNGAHLCRTQM